MTDLLTALKQLRENGPYNRDGGICSQLLFSSCVDLGTLHHMMSRWPKYSGILAYPIPSTMKGLMPRTCYNYHIRKRNQWTGRNAYSKLRYELLDFMIAELSKDAAC